MRLTETQARIITELDRGNIIIARKDARGRRYSRWQNARGKTRAGKPGVGTWRSFRKRGWIEPEDIGVDTWAITTRGTEIAASVDFAQYTRKRKVKVTANDVLKGLETYYSQMGLVLIPEVSIAYGGERRADALVVGTGNETAIAIEIKVSRQDFKHEMESPEKRQLALDLSSQYYFAAPEGLIRVSELPEEAGLLELGVDGTISVTVEAPHRRPGMPDWRLVGAVARALKR